MKKLFITMMTCVISLSQFSVVSAYSEDEVKAEATNLEELYEEAENNLSEEVEVYLESEDGTEVYSLDGYVLDDGTSETYITAIPSAVFDDNYAIDTCSSGSGSNSAYDNSYSVYATVKYNYSQTTKNGYTGYLLNSVSGSWQIKDSSVTLSSRNIIYACTGLTFSGSLNSSQYVSKNISSNSFSYSTGFSTYVINDGSLSTMGITSSVTLKHGSSSSWKLTVKAKAF